MGGMKFLNRACVLREPEEKPLARLNQGCAAERGFSLRGGAR